MEDNNKVPETVWPKERESSVKATYLLPFQAKCKDYLEQTHCP